MKRFLSFFSLLLIAAVQSWAGLPTPKVENVQLYENGPMWAALNLGETFDPDDYPAQEAYDYLVSLIGDKVYASYNSRIFVNEEGALQIDNDDRTPDELVVNGNVYEIGNQKFVVENGAIAHIYEMHGDEIVSEYGVVVPESELVALMGNNVYVASMDEEGENIISVSEGQIMFDNVPMSIAVKAVATKIGDNYVYSAKDFDMVFVVVDGEVLRVDIGSGGEVYGSFEKQSSTPIAQIGETIYTDVEKFMDAFEEIEGNATVQLLGDIILPDYDFLGNKDENANITLDLNGHNITGNRYEDAVIIVAGKLTISGEGVVENTGEYGDVVGCEGYGYVGIYGGTYIGKADICYCYFEGALFINGGKFNAPKLYYDNDDYFSAAPTVKGGLFSMDPTDCLVVGYEVVENIDEETKDVYPFMVVESDVDLTNPAGLLAVPQAGELNVRAYFTAMPGMPYLYALLRGEYHSLKEAKENSEEEDFVYSTPIPQNATAPLQAINIKDSSIELEDGEVYTLVVFSDNIQDIEDEPIMELAVIAFTVGEGEIAPESILVEAGKLNTSASFSVSDEDVDAGAAYSCLLFEGRITNFVQAMLMAKMLHAIPVYVSQVPVAIESNDVEITLSSDEVELVAGKEYTLVIYDPTRRIPVIGLPEIGHPLNGLPLFYDFIHYKAVEKNTETAIEAVNADKAQKAVKTIENGRVVIIRGNKKYDLSGREL